VDLAKSHQTVPQVQAMLHGDKARKDVLVDYGFRLAEDLMEYYADLGVRVQYLHSDVDTRERIEESDADTQLFAACTDNEGHEHHQGRRRGNGGIVRGPTCIVWHWRQRRAELHLGTSSWETGRRAL